MKSSPPAGGWRLHIPDLPGIMRPRPHGRGLDFQPCHDKRFGFMKHTSLLAVAAAGFVASMMVAAAPVQADAAKAFKKNRCAQCHTISGKHTIGPSLNGIIGRKAGTADGFKASRYSKSMVAAGEKGLVWDAKSLDGYLANPKQFLRDYLDDPKASTKMAYPGLKKEDQRALVIEYLTNAK
ncbi:MAG: cytochrome C [Rhodospirillaceae bacterium]|nr:cytochrome C [Rhodospirillaceae bacterium]